MLKIKDMDELAIMTDVIKEGKRHKWYDRTVKKAEKYLKIMTGEGIETLLQQFVVRETTEAFTQRKALTKLIVPTVAQNTMKPFYKIPKSNNFVRYIYYEGGEEDKKAQEKKQEFIEIVGQFWGKHSVDNYLDTRYFELNPIDPNAWLIVEWNDFDSTQEHALPYPFEAKSYEAIYFEYERYELQYLVIKKEFEYKSDTYSGKYDVYTGYFHDRAVIFEELPEGKTDKEGQRVTIAAKGGKEKEYLIIEPEPYNLGFVPAVRFGYNRDAYTDGETYLSPIDEAIPILEKMIKANSEMDLTMALHAFPQKLAYTKRCQNKGCNQGVMPDGSMCDVCKGSGKAVHTSAQDIIELDLPFNKEDMIDLNQMVTYIYPPVDLIKFQDEYIKSLTGLCKEAVFNSDIFSRQEIAETATGKNISLDNLYDTLYPCAVDYSEKWKFLIGTIADVTDMDSGLQFNFQFSNDFKLKSLTDLYADLQKANESNADSYVKRSIQTDIARILFNDDEYAMKVYTTKLLFAPFSGFSSQEIQSIISGGMTTQFNIVLWANYSQIFDEIERDMITDGKSFYDLPKVKQWDKITEKVNAIILEIEGEKKSKEPTMVL